MGDLVWDERLIGQSEAYQLAGDWPWHMASRQGIGYLDCARCGQALLVLGAAANGFSFTTDGLVAAVLRHGVTAHNLILNRKNRKGQSDVGTDRGSGGDPRRDDRGAQESGPVPGGRHRAPAAVGRDLDAGEPGASESRRGRHSLPGGGR